MVLLEILLRTGILGMWVLCQVAFNPVIETNLDQQLVTASYLDILTNLWLCSKLQ